MKLDYTPLVDTGFGEPLILLHGAFGNLSNWSYVLHEFSPTHRVLIPRLPFFSLPVSAERLDDLVRYLENFIEHFRLNKITLIGNSLGGHLALWLAWHHPSRMKNIVLAGGSGLFENSSDDTFEAVNDYLFGATTADRRANDFDAVQNETKTLSTPGIVHSVRRKNLPDVLNQIQTPTLLLWGLNDSITPPEIALQFHENLPKSKVVFLEECGHAPMTEQPKTFNQHVRKFLER